MKDSEEVVEAKDIVLKKKDVKLKLEVIDAIILLIFFTIISLLFINFRHLLPFDLPF
jgi:hypothetical protein